MDLAGQANDIYVQTLSVAGLLAMTLVGPQAIPMLFMAGLTSAAFLTGIN